VCINTSSAPKGVFKYFPGFSGAEEVYLNIYPARDKYYLSDTSSAPEKPGKYLKPRRRRSIYTHFCVPEKCLYTLILRRRGRRSRRSIYIHPSEALPATARILNRSFTPKSTGNCELRTCPKSLYVAA